jgi:competence protein ComEC
MALLAAPIAARLPGPRWLVDALAVTIAAQAGVAPLLTSAFGGLPLASVPANLLAAPVAGPIMSWGMTAGLLAGVLGGGLATVLHLPTRFLLWWLTGVARTMGGAPLGFLDGRDVLLVAVLGCAAWWLRRWWALAVLVVVAVVAARPVAVAGAIDVARGAELWRGAGGAHVLVLEGPADAGRVLEGLHRRGVRRLALVVATAGNRDVAGTIADIRSRVPVGAIAAPPDHRIRDATEIDRPFEVDVGGLRVSLRPVGRGLVAEIGRAPPTTRGAR